MTRRVFDLLGEQAGGVARFFAIDHLSTITEVVGASGAVLSRFAFDPWGRHEVIAGANAWSVAFAAQDAHSGSGLYLTRYRAYSPELGRWLSEDPTAFHAGMNFYRYVDNGPVAFTDPDGLSPTVRL